jgi:glutamate/tyrosine decarboxylase-like PLP-dependent enzyme
MRPEFENDLDLYFLGPKSEQRQFLEETLQLVLNDHIFWRRNYFPKDPPPIAYSKAHGEKAWHFREVFFTELFALISDLKLDVPVFSPRYMAHMISETTLPSMVAYFATLLYNPNNVSSEASPVTIRHELEVGKQFARLFGYDDARSFGHLTSGGTIANYESLWYNKAGRFLPLAMEMASRMEDGKTGQTGGEDLFRTLNVPLDEVQLRLNDFLSYSADPEERWASLRKYLVSYVGDFSFKRMAERVWQSEWVEPVVIVPSTAHYSWSRAASLLGIGKNNFIQVAVDQEFRMVPEALDDALRECQRMRRPVWQIVAVAGTTEFGSVDPIDEIVAIRDAHSPNGMYAPIHVDGAYGGYFSTMFIPGQTGVTLSSDVFSESLKRAFKGIPGTDSVTVDPHKAGYTPYGAGSIILKHGFLKDLVAETAPYCLDREDTTQQESPSPQLGKFILEGSKPGAVAAAVWFSHKLIPLNLDGYGHQLAIVCEIAREFDRLVGLREDLHSLFRPHTNIVCILARKAGLTRISEMNALNEHLAARFGVREVASIQSYDYLVSRTTVKMNSATIRADTYLCSLVPDAEELVVLRLVFMNRWVRLTQSSGKTYLTDFLDLLEAEVQASK